MDLHGLDLNLLIILDILLEERSVTRTSERVHLSQSATSAALSRLRSFFEDDLIVAVGRKMVLTPRAEALIQPVRDFVTQGRVIVGSKRSFLPSGTAREFTLMMSDYAAVLLMPELIPRVARQAPGVKIQIITELDVTMKALDQGQIDLLILPRQALASGSPAHPCEDLFEEDYVCIAWSGNTLVGESLSLDRYLALGHVGLKGGGTIDSVELEKLGYRRRMEVLTTAFNIVPELVVGTNRIATVHRRLAKRQAAYLPLKLLEPPLPISSFTEAIHWHKNRADDLAIGWLKALIQQAVKATQ